MPVREQPDDRDPGRSRPSFARGAAGSPAGDEDLVRLVAERDERQARQRLDCRSRPLRRDRGRPAVASHPGPRQPARQTPRRWRPGCEPSQRRPADPKLGPRAGRRASRRCADRSAADRQGRRDRPWAAVTRFRNHRRRLDPASPAAGRRPRPGPTASVARPDSVAGVGAAPRSSPGRERRAPRPRCPAQDRGVGRQGCAEGHPQRSAAVVDLERDAPARCARAERDEGAACHDEHAPRGPRRHSPCG